MGTGLSTRNIALGLGLGDTPDWAPPRAASMRFSPKVIAENKALAESAKSTKSSGESSISEEGEGADAARSDSVEVTAE